MPYTAESRQNGKKRGDAQSYPSHEIAAEISREIEALIAPRTTGEIDFEAVETALRRCALALAARLMEKRLNCVLSQRFDDLWYRKAGHQ